MLRPHGRDWTGSSFGSTMRRMLGSPLAIRIALLSIMTLAIAGWLWRMRALTGEASGSQATDRYEGSSGMGADGFGGWPSKPDAPR